MSEVIAAARARPLGVVAMCRGHEQRAQVGVADAELPVVAGRTRDRFGREIGEADRVSIAVMINSTACSNAFASNVSSSRKNLSRVEAGQVARTVVQAHVLTTGIGRGDPAGLRIGVPVVDGVVVLDAGIGAPQQPWPSCRTVPGVHCLENPTIGTGPQCEIAAVLDGT